MSSGAPTDNTKAARYDSCNCRTDRLTEHSDAAASTERMSPNPTAKGGVSAEVQLSVLVTDCNAARPARSGLGLPLWNAQSAGEEEQC